MKNFAKFTEKNPDIEYFLNIVSRYRPNDIAEMTMPIISGYGLLKKEKGKIDQMPSFVMHIFEWIFKKDDNKNSFVLNY